MAYGSLKGTLSLPAAKFNSPNHTLLHEQRTELFNALAIDAKVAVSQSRRRAHRDDILRLTQMKLEIVDKTENCAGTLGVNIIACGGDHTRSGQIANQRASYAPALSRWHGELKGRNPVRLVIGVARHAIRRRWAGRKARMSDAEGFGLPTRTREERHDDNYQDENARCGTQVRVD